MTTGVQNPSLWREMGRDWPGSLVWVTRFNSQQNSGGGGQFALGSETGGDTRSCEGFTVPVYNRVGVFVLTCAWAGFTSTSVLGSREEKMCVRVGFCARPFRLGRGAFGGCGVDGRGGYGAALVPCVTPVLSS